MSQGIPPAPLFYRSLQRDFSRSLERGDQSYETPCHLSAEAQEELHWWERWNGKSPSAGVDNRIRCIPQRMGSSVNGNNNGCPVVPGGKGTSHQLPRNYGSNASNQDVGRHLSPNSDRQHHSSGIYKPPGRDSVPSSSGHYQIPMDVVSGKKYCTESSIPSRSGKYASRQGIKGDERSIRLDAEPSYIRGHTGYNGPSQNRPICVTSDSTTTPVLQLAPRPSGTSNRCPTTRLEWTAGICQSPRESDGQNPGQSAEGHSRIDATDSSSVAITTLVSNTTGSPNRLSKTNHTPGKPAAGDCRVSTPRTDPPASREAYLKQRFEAESLSEGASKLLLASWRAKSSASYDSMFKKWISWCEERGSDPIPVSDVANFLANLYEKGYQQRSINAYQSAIASAHDKVNGVSVGQHPTISRLIAGVANARPPQPRYTSTWDINIVLRYLEGLGNNNNLPLKGLTMKTAMLLALTRPSRLTDLQTQRVYGFTHPNQQSKLKLGNLPKVSSSHVLKKTIYCAQY